MDGCRIAKSRKERENTVSSKGCILQGCSNHPMSIIPRWSLKNKNSNKDMEVRLLTHTTSKAKKGKPGPKQLDKPHHRTPNNTHTHTVQLDRITRGGAGLGAAEARRCVRELPVPNYMYTSSSFSRSITMMHCPRCHRRAVVVDDCRSPNPSPIAIVREP